MGVEVSNICVLKYIWEHTLDVLECIPEHILDVFEHILDVFEYIREHITKYLWYWR